jgi:hypothetical protein
MKREQKSVIELLRKIVADPTQPAKIRREAQLALDNHARLKGEEQKPK